MTAPNAEGVLVIDETGDRKAGHKTAHVGRQYLGSVGKIDDGIVSVTSLWADTQVYYHSLSMSSGSSFLQAQVNKLPLGEGSCQTRTGQVPSLLAQLNSAVLSLMDRIRVRNVPRQMRYFDVEYDQALDLTSQCSVY